jgi:hypothetical protein
VFPVGIGLRAPGLKSETWGTLRFHLSALQGGTSFVISLPTRPSESAARCVVHGAGVTTLPLVVRPGDDQKRALSLDEQQVVLPRGHRGVCPHCGLTPSIAASASPSGRWQRLSLPA